MVTVLAGSNSFLVHTELDKLITSFVVMHGDMALERLDCEESTYERIAEAVQSLPFLASKKLVILYSPSANKQFIEQAEALLADISEVTDIVLVEPKLDKRTSYYKWLKKHTEFKDFAELDGPSLANWAVDFAKEQDAELSISDANYLVERLGTNQQHLSNEIKKLILVDKKIIRDTIDSLTEPTPQSKIFDLLDAAFDGNTKKALLLYKEQRNMKVEPQEILAMIGWQLRQVSLAKTAGTKHDIVHEAKISPYSASKAKAIASHLTLQRLKELVYDLIKIDARSKRESIDLDEALQSYILRIS